MDEPSILFAYDFSERSDRAAKRAFQMAKEHRLPVHAVHVVDEAFPERKWLDEAQSESHESIVDRLKDAITKRLESTLKPVAAEFDMPFKAHGALGYVAEQLHAIGDQNQSKLLVIGAHGRHAVRDMMLGATAEQLLWYMTPPTLIVRDDQPAPYQKLMIAADFSAEAEAAMKASVNWFPSAQVRVLHVIDSRAEERLRDAGLASEALQTEHAEQEEAARAKLEEMIANSGLNRDNTEIYIIHGHPVEEVAAQAESYNADLVVMGGHGRNRLTRWLPGRVASRLVHQLPCDVMLARSE